MDLLRVKNLNVKFKNGRNAVCAVDSVSFEVKKGEILGIVGESGCGKTTICKSLLNLNRNAETSGEIIFENRNIPELSEKEMQEIRGGKIAMIFQNPSSSLNPVVKIGRQITEVMQLHLGIGKKEAEEKAISLLEKMGIAQTKEKMREYPFQQSGGINQRIMIAIALSCRPSLLAADEPTASMDAVIQRQILDIIAEIRKEQDLSIVFVTHNLGLVLEIADRILVMRNGKIVEEGEVKKIFNNPADPYTKLLLSSIPLISKNNFLTN